MSSEIIRRHLRFSGRVQGVAFRYRAKEICGKLGLTGWVCNEYNGDVEMEVQGPRETINEMIRMIHAQPYIYIDGIESAEIASDPDERSFHISSGY